ncbi:sensor histidine kinase [Paenibacillus sp. 481]|uniref:sensor histidine kinase n=1 Tax=Paenibacillus sp. 481 TaxID=2835869 RepID=UPI001E5E37B4|nr:hypothetical protein [Paenibacillus sp. 481]UHA72361.1 hypothetical protein KIK04_16985 [Paenibacillus sp. 481]
MSSKIYPKLGGLIFVLLHIWFIWITFQHPFIGIRTQLENGKWHISEMDRLDIANKYDLRIGDVVTSIDGKSPEQNVHIVRWRAIEQVDWITVARGEHTKTIYIADLPKEWSTNLMPLLTELILFAIAAYLWRRRNHAPSARLLACLFFLMGTIYMCIGASFRGDPISVILITTAVALFPIMLLHFLILFFHEKGGIVIPKRLLVVLYSIVGLELIGKLLYFHPNFAYPVYRTCYWFTYIFVIVVIILNIIVLTHLSIRYRKEQAYLSAVIRFIWLSIIAAFAPVIVLSLLPRWIGGTFIVSPLVTGWFTFIIPILFIYLTAFHRLYDIDVVVRRTVTVLLIAMVPSALIVGLNGLIFSATATMAYQVISFLFIVIVLTFVLYSLEYFRNKLESVMYPRSTRLHRLLQNVSGDLSSVSTVPDTADVILHSLMKGLYIKGAAVVMKFPHESLDTYINGDVDHYLLERHIRTGECQHPNYQWFELERNEDYVCFVVVVHHELSTNTTNMEENNWIQKLFGLVRIGLNKSYSMQEMKKRIESYEQPMQHPSYATTPQGLQLVLTLFDTQEKGKAKLVRTVQETVMQPLHELNTTLKHWSSWKDTINHEELRMAGEKLETVNQQLGHLCFALQPKLIETVGFANAIQHYIDLEFEQLGSEVTFERSVHPLLDAQSPSFKLHLFRVAQELLMNARKHAYAERIYLGLWADLNGIIMYYEDDGVGFDPGAVFGQQVQSRGLKQMRARVLTQQGDVEWKVTPNQGVVMEIIIPYPSISSEQS